MKINNENELTEYLTENIQKYIPECHQLILADQPLFENFSHLGVPDLVYMTKHGFYVVIEVKYLDFNTTGRTATTRRTKQRRKVFQQANMYRKLVASKYGISLQNVMPYVFTNDPSVRSRNGVRAICLLFSKK